VTVIAPRDLPPRYRSSEDGILRSIARVATTAVMLVLLAGILAVLAYLAHSGLTVEVQGVVSLDGTPTGILGDVHLIMDEPVSMVATGPDAGPVTASLSAATCPRCGGVMLPVRWRPLSGEIEWRCIECDLRAGEADEP